MEKGLKLKVRKFSGLISTLVQVTGEKLIGEAFPPTWVGKRIPLTIYNLLIRHKFKCCNHHFPAYIVFLLLLFFCSTSPVVCSSMVRHTWYIFACIYLSSFNDVYRFLLLEMERLSGKLLIANFWNSWSFLLPQIIGV